VLRFARWGLLGERFERDSLAREEAGPQALFRFPVKLRCSPRNVRRTCTPEEILSSLPFSVGYLHFQGFVEEISSNQSHIRICDLVAVRR
jgi:hypothetical protein